MHGFVYVCLYVFAWLYVCIFLFGELTSLSDPFSEPLQAEGGGQEAKEKIKADTRRRKLVSDKWRMRSSDQRETCQNFN